MKNIEWLRTLDADALVERLNTTCSMCVYDGDKCGDFGTTCRGGIRKWLDLEHEENEESDSWERLKEAARLCATQYWACSGCLCKECPSKINGRKPHEHYGADDCNGAQKLDLLRRSRELQGISRKS